MHVFVKKDLVFQVVLAGVCVFFPLYAMEEDRQYAQANQSTAFSCGAKV